MLDIETTGLKEWFGDRITCICAKDSDGNRFGMVDKDEFNLIDAFMAWLCRLKFYSNIKQYMFLTKKGKQFDIPFILSRFAILNGLAKDDDILDLLKCDHFDLQEITSKRISLQSMAELLNCKTKSGTGMNAIKLWNEGRYKELKEYCMRDVDVTEEVFLKWKKLQKDM